MSEIITFDKSFVQRYEEYSEIFDSILPVCLIKKTWISYLEMTIDLIGWQAVWKIPRLTCESLKIHFPAVVLVLVLDIDFQELKAIVRVLALQDDIVIPEINRVPLIQLWPTNDQDKSLALNIEKTADALDKLRFFYSHLFMPWDQEENNSDWKDDHLENRLRLYYDLKYHKIPRATAKHIHSLLTEARRLQNKRELIELKMSQNEDISQETEVYNKLEGKLMEIHVRLLEIRTEIDIIEHPRLREIKIRRYSDIVASCNETKQKIWIIYNSGTADEYIDFLQFVKNYYPTEPLIISTSLSEVLETADTKDIYLLNESQHSIIVTGVLKSGWMLKGIGLKDKIILTSKIEDVMLDIIGESTIIENITIDALTAQCGILVQKGRCILRNCKILGETISTHQGIIVLSDATLEMEDCDISGFSTAIIGNSESTIIMRNCIIHYVDIGLKIFDKCSLNMTKVRFENCEEYGVVLETDSGDDNVIGDFEKLNIVPEITVDCVSGINNLKGNVVFNQKNKLKPVEDLFAIPDMDPTVIFNPDETMDFNQTLTS